jgi:phosphoglycerate dehydrogenase-like enzyme
MKLSDGFQADRLGSSRNGNARLASEALSSFWKASRFGPLCRTISLVVVSQIPLLLQSTFVQQWCGPTFPRPLFNFVVSRPIAGVDDARIREMNKRPFFILAPLSVPAIETSSLTAVKVLSKLNSDRKIDFLLPNAVTDIGDYIPRANCVISRPTTGGNDLPRLVDRLLEEGKRFEDVFVIGSVSKGLSPALRALAKPQNAAHSATATTNAESVADLVIWFANEFFRPFSSAARSMASLSGFSPVGPGNLPADRSRLPHFRILGLERSERLAGKRWSFLGIGDQAAATLRRLIAMGVHRFSAFHHTFAAQNDDEITEKIKTFLQESLGPIHPSDLAIQPDLATAGDFLNLRVEFGGRVQFELKACKTLLSAVDACDVVSIHFPEKGDPKGFVTVGCVDEKILSHMACSQRRPLLINVARQAIWDEAYVASLVEQGKLRAASDLLNAESENAADIDLKLHPLLKLANRFCGGFSDLPMLDRSVDSQGQLSFTIPFAELMPVCLLTRHIGGTTRDDLERIGAEVVARCLLDVESLLELSPGELLPRDQRERLATAAGVSDFILSSRA